MSTALPRTQAPGPSREHFPGSTFFAGLLLATLIAKVEGQVEGHSRELYCEFDASNLQGAYPPCFLGELTLGDKTQLPMSNLH